MQWHTTGLLALATLTASVSCAHSERRVMTSDDLRSWINARVAARYQQLQGVAIVDDFPRSTAGKTLKRVLRDQYATPSLAVA